MTAPIVRSRADDGCNIQMGHSILQADDKPILGKNGFDHLRHPFRVIRLHDEKNEVELLFDLRDLAKVQRRHFGIDRARRQIDCDALSRIASTWAGHCSMKVTS